MMLEIKKLNQFTGHEGAIYALEYNVSDQLIYSGGFDNVIVGWDINVPGKYKAIAKLESKTISLKYIAELNWLLTGQSNGSVHILDLNLNKEIYHLKEHDDMIFDMVYDHSTNLLYVGSGDGFLSIWNLADISLRTRINLSSKKNRTLKIVDNLLYVGCGDGTIKVFNNDTLVHQYTISDHDFDFSVNCIAFTADFNYMLSGSRDGHLNVYEASDSYVLIKRLPAHNFAIYDICFSPDGAYFATCSRDKSIKIWKTEGFEFQDKIDSINYKGHTASVNSLVWIGKRIISTGDDRSIIVWEIN